MAEKVGKADTVTVADSASDHGDAALLADDTAVAHMLYDMVALLLDCWKTVKLSGQEGRGMASLT